MAAEVDPPIFALEPSWAKRRVPAERRTELNSQTETTSWGVTFPTSKVVQLHNFTSTGTPSKNLFPTSNFAVFRPHPLLPSPEWPQGHCPSPGARETSWPSSRNTQPVPVGGCRAWMELGSANQHVAVGLRNQCSVESIVLLSAILGDFERCRRASRSATCSSCPEVSNLFLRRVKGITEQKRGRVQKRRPSGFLTHASIVIGGMRRPMYSTSCRTVVEGPSHQTVHQAFVMAAA